MSDKIVHITPNTGDALSQRETEILTWSARGKTYPEISIILSIAEDTIKTYVERASKKLNATNKTHAVAVAVARGLIKV